MIAAHLLGAGLFVMQTSGAVVVGTVRDARTNAPLAGAVVHLTDLQRSTVADSLGSWILAGVPAGPWHLSVDAFGYASKTVPVRAGRRRAGSRGTGRDERGASP